MFTILIVAMVSWVIHVSKLPFIHFRCVVIVCQLYLNIAVKNIDLKVNYCIESLIISKQNKPFTFYMVTNVTFYI